PAPHRRGCRDDDAGSGTALAVLTLGGQQNTIPEHPHGHRWGATQRRPFLQTPQAMRTTAATARAPTTSGRTEPSSFWVAPTKRACAEAVASSMRAAAACFCRSTITLGWL